MPKYIYGLRTCPENMISRDNFQWPMQGKVKCLNWDPNPRCTGGLYFLKNGQGNPSWLNWDLTAKWIVLQTTSCIEFDGKAKSEEVKVLFVGDRFHSTEFMKKFVKNGQPIIGATYVAGDNEIATAGDNGIATAGDNGTATAGDGGTATAGDDGTATAGNGGTATAGDYGTATAGYCGTATAGDCGIIQISYYKNNRKRIKVGYIGEDGLLPNVKYRLNSLNEFKAVK